MRHLKRIIPWGCCCIFSLGLFSLSAVTFSLPERNASPETEIVIPVVVSGFERILAFQFTLRWDESVLDFVSVEGLSLPLFSIGNFNASQKDSGYLTVSWDEQSDFTKGQTVDDGAVLFGVRFRVRAGVGGVTALTISDTPTRKEVVDVSFAAIEFHSLDGRVVVVSPNTGGSPDLSHLPERVQISSGEEFQLDFEVETPDFHPDGIELRVAFEPSGWMADGYPRVEPLDSSIGSYRLRLLARPGTSGVGALGMILNQGMHEVEHEMAVEVISVNQTPRIQPVPDLTMKAGTRETVDLIIRDADHPPSELSVQLEFSHPSLISGSEFQLLPTAEGVRLELFPSSKRLGQTEVLVSVSDREGATDSTRFFLNVEKADILYPMISFQYDSGKLTLTWVGEAVLESAHDLSTGFFEIRDAKSPFLVTSDGTTMFFRLRQATH